MAHPRYRATSSDGKFTLDFTEHEVGEWIAHLDGNEYVISRDKTPRGFVYDILVNDEPWGDLGPYQTSTTAMSVAADIAQSMVSRQQNAHDHEHGACCSSCALGNPCESGCSTNPHWPKGLKLDGVEVYDKLNDQKVIYWRADGTGEKEFNRALSKYGSRHDQYVVQGVTNAGEILIDNQGGAGGEIRVFESRNPYQGDAFELAQYRKKREEWERRGRRGPPPVPPSRRPNPKPAYGSKIKLDRRSYVVEETTRDKGGHITFLRDVKTGDTTWMHTAELEDELAKQRKKKRKNPDREATQLKNKLLR